MRYPIMKLSVILVSYNTREMTLDCLRTLGAALAAVEAEIWVVDNASTDGSADAIAAQFPDVELIVSAHNLGFGPANNLAMKRARGAYFLLLNTDAFPQGDAVAQMVSYLDAHARVGAVGPRLRNGDGSHQESVHQVITPGHSWRNIAGLSRLNKTPPHQTGCVADDCFLKGACLLVRREVWEQVGGFDERFFFYWEDADWCQRIANRGWELAYLDEARVTHLSGASARHWIYSALTECSASEYLVWKRSGLAGVANLHLSWLAYALSIWLREIAPKLARRQRADAGKIMLCRWLIRLALTPKHFASSRFTTRIRLPRRL